MARLSAESPAFLQNHREVIAAFDFFTLPTVTLRMLYGFFVIEHQRRKTVHCNVTPHPTAEWVVQQLRDTFPGNPADSATLSSIETESSMRRSWLSCRQLGLEAKRTSVQAPRQTGIAERWIGSCRQEILDRVLTLNEQHLRRIVRD
jgi:hypothetical protein